MIFQKSPAIHLALVFFYISMIIQIPSLEITGIFIEFDTNQFSSNTIQILRIALVSITIHHLTQVKKIVEKGELE